MGKTNGLLGRPAHLLSGRFFQFATFQDFGVCSTIEAPPLAVAVRLAATMTGLSPTQLKHLSMSHFYTFDGTWRQAEPSWRVMLQNDENIRGCPSKGHSLNDPAMLNSLQRGRRSLPQPKLEVREPGDPAAAAAAAAAFRPGGTSID